MIDTKSISSEELAKETFKLAESLKELNCFVTMNKDGGIEKAIEVDGALSLIHISEPTRRP